MLVLLTALLLVATGCRDDFFLLRFSLPSSLDGSRVGCFAVSLGIDDQPVRTQRFEVNMYELSGTFHPDQAALRGATLMATA